MTISDQPTHRRYLSVASIGALALLTISCSNAEPKGQVIATVNGVEITVAELNEEARARGLAIANDKALRESLIKDLVDRKLLVQKAIEQKLDRSPEHLLATHRMNEVMLAQQLVAASSQQPGSSLNDKANELIKSNPAAFQDRALIWVDQITLAPVKDPSLRQAIGAAESIEALEKLLAKSGMKWRRSVEAWDTASMSRDVNARLLSSGPEKMFLFPSADRLVAGKVVSVERKPVPERDRLPIARDMVLRQQSDAAFQNLLRSARDGASIKYQAEFAPKQDSSS